MYSEYNIFSDIPNIKYSRIFRIYDEYSFVLSFFWILQRTQGGSRVNHNRCPTQGGYPPGSLIMLDVLGGQGVPLDLPPWQGGTCPGL